MLLLLVPVAGIFLISTTMFNDNSNNLVLSQIKPLTAYGLENKPAVRIKITGLVTSLINLFISLIVFIFFNFSSNQFQFVQEYHNISNFDFYLGVDGISIYFVLLTTFIMPIALLSN
jgi:NADH:ubiquinone oxidoreductase subunit 4 (subunit M)